MSRPRMETAVSNPENDVDPLTEAAQGEPVVEPEDAEDDVAVTEAQAREADDLGDPDAEDGGAAEEPSDTDPDPLLNDDADDPLDDLPDGEDNDDDLDGDVDEAPAAP